MSLLNQVLQDLDERAPSGARQPLHLAAVSEPVANADAHARAEGRNWVRIGVWSAVGVLVALAAWLFHGGESDAPEPKTVTPPAMAVAATNPVPSVPKPETVARLSSPVPVSAADPQPPGVPEPAVVEPDSDPVRQTVALVPETAATVGDAVQPSPVERHEKVESRLPAESTVVPPGDYLPLRNTRLPPSEKEKPQGVRHGTHSSVNVKTAKKSVPQPLVAVREAIADGELATAEYLLRQRLDAAPADREARELLIGLMLRGARYDDVGEQLDLGLSHYPGHIKFVLIKARLLAQAGEVDVAVRLLEDASASSDGKVERLQMLGALYQQQLNYQKALDSYQSLLELAPDAGPVWVGLAISLDALGDVGALDAYRRALRLGGLPAAAEQYSLRRTRQLESDGG